MQKQCELKEMSKLKKALEKARLNADNLSDQQTTKARNEVKPVKESRVSSRQEVAFQFSETKTQSISHKLLRKNKIFALFSKNKVNDQIKTLRVQVLRKLEKNGTNSLLVTSANPGEGKSFTSINLGVSIAQELDRTVLIVDADLKNPAKKHYDFAKDFFNVDVHLGLADVLTGKAELNEALINPGIEKLTILPGGTYLHNSAELIGSPKMEYLVQELKERYQDRVVIFDTPAILACADPVALSKFVESVLFVVEEEKTTSEDVKQAMALLSDVQIIGMILNKSKNK
jgi:protein-tyrosine kinase